MYRIKILKDSSENAFTIQDVLKKINCKDGKKSEQSNVLCIPFVIQNKEVVFYSEYV